MVDQANGTATARVGAGDGDLTGPAEGSKCARRVTRDGGYGADVVAHRVQAVGHVLGPGGILVARALVAMNGDPRAAAFDEQLDHALAGAHCELAADMAVGQLTPGQPGAAALRGALSSLTNACQSGCDAGSGVRARQENLRHLDGERGLSRQFCVVASFNLKD